MISQLEIEKKWQAFWKANKTFVAKPTKQKKYFGTVPFPYANSALHIGHGRTFTAADIILRYHRLKGENVLYPLAFHISGTPVLAVADGISRGDKKTIDLARTSVQSYVPNSEEVEKILKTFTSVNAIAEFFSSKMEETFESVGLAMDYTKTFSTGDKGYQKFVQWQYRHLEKEGILIQGKYPILFSPKDESAVGEDDIKDGDLDKVSVQEMIYILFKEKETIFQNSSSTQTKDKKEDVYFCVATLRPDALFGTSNLWVDPSHDILKVKVNKQLWYVNKEAYNKLVYQFDSVEIIEELKGEKLLGKTFITPLINREVPVASAPFIDPKHGTGLVYSSPAGSPHDYMGLLEAKADGRLPKSIEVIQTVQSKDKKGNIIVWDGECAADHMRKKYAVTKSDDPKLEEAKQELYKIEHYSGVLTGVGEPWDGLPIKWAKDKVTQALVDAKLGGIFYDTSRRAITRAGNEVIVANLQGQWFLDYSNPEVKAKAKALLSRMSFYPSNLRATQKAYLDWVQKRPCARKRGIGTPLPQDPEWIIEPLSDSTIYPFYYIIAGFINSGKLKVEDLNDELLDYFYKGGSKPNIEGAEELKKEVSYWKNFDFRYTASPHLSNHLSFLIYHNALLFTEEYQPRNITIGGLLIKDGEKISKSKGNGIPFIKVRELYGADLYRLYVAVGASFDTEMDFRDEEIKQLEKKFNKWKELLFEAKKVLDNKVINTADDDIAKEYESYSEIDKWLISRFYTRSKEYFEVMESMGIRDAYVTILYELLNEINYHTRRTSKEQTAKTVAFFFKDYVKLMTPVVPHICEELLEGSASTSIFETEIDKYINKESEYKEAMVQEILSTLDRKISEKKIQQENLTKIIILMAEESTYKFFDKLKQLLEEKTSPKELMGKLMKEYGKTHGKLIKNFVPKTFGSGIHYYEQLEKERKRLEQLKPYLEELYGVEVIVKQGEGIGPKPGRPVVQIETKK